MITRIEEAVPPREPRPSEPALEAAPRTSPVELRSTPSTRRLFDIVDEGVPAEPVRFRPPAPRAPEPPAVTKQTVCFVTESQPAVTKRTVCFVPAPRRPAAPREPRQDRPSSVPVPLPSEPLPASDPEAITQPGPFMASGWPELAARPPEDDEPWRAAESDAARRRRLDLEQRGKPWSE